MYSEVTFIENISKRQFQGLCSFMSAVIKVLLQVYEHVWQIFTFSLFAYSEFRIAFNLMEQLYKWKGKSFHRVVMVFNGATLKNVISERISSPVKANGLIVSISNKGGITDTADGFKSSSAFCRKGIPLSEIEPLSPPWAWRRKKKTKAQAFLPFFWHRCHTSPAWLCVVIIRELGGVVSVANPLFSIILKAVSDRIHPQQQVVRSPRPLRYDWSGLSDQATGHGPGRTEATLLTEVLRRGWESD